MNLQGGSQKFRIISFRSQLKSDWSIRDAGINRELWYIIITNLRGYQNSKMIEAILIGQK